jgi:hypothetical protein
MQSFIIKPILGLKTNVAPNDPSLFQMVGDYTALTHCVDGRNVDYGRTRNACAKSVGTAEWSNSAIGSPTNCLGIFELYDGTNRTYWMVYDGDVYRYDSGRDPQEVADAGATAFASDPLDIYSMIQYGSYFVFSDFGENTPYCSDFNDANLTKLVNAGTEYKGKFLESFQRRILLANITSGMAALGDRSLIWTDVNPTPSTSCTFGSGDPPTNHLYLPVDDIITGMKRMGKNACFVASANSINRLDYYANYVTPFGFTTVVENQGWTNHHSIIDIGGMHLGFNKNYGFCAFNGSPDFPLGGRPISYDIENWIRDIRAGYYGAIVGAVNPFKNEASWTVPLDGSSTPNTVLSYDYVERKWRRKDIVARYIVPATISTDLTWTMLINNLGYTTWSDLGNLRWADLIDETPDLMFSPADGKLYYNGTEADNGSAWDGFRIEPIMDFGEPNNRDLLLEIWFNLAETGSYSLYCYYRGGDTVGECKAAAWTTLPEISCDSPSNAVTRLAETNRFHQIKWGTDVADEPFIVSEIEFKYVTQGRY